MQEEPTLWVTNTPMLPHKCVTCGTQLPLGLYWSYIYIYIYISQTLIDSLNSAVGAFALAQAYVRKGAEDGI